jgi:hypothetical protein
MPKDLNMPSPNNLDIILTYKFDRHYLTRYYEDYEQIYLLLFSPVDNDPLKPPDDYYKLITKSLLKYIPKKSNELNS